MKKLALTTAAALFALTAAVYASGEWVYEGQWGGTGPSPGPRQAGSKFRLTRGQLIERKGGDASVSQ
jgi:hypothetical protein